MNQTGRPAVFLDRDGTINEEVEYLRDPDALRILPGAVEGIGMLNGAGIPVYVVTNQSGVGRGMFGRDAVDAVHERLARLLADRGTRVDGLYYCPHGPDQGCECRKPRPGMILRAAREHRIDLQRSVIVGDKSSDLEAGRRAGCRTILVATGYGAQALRTIISPGAGPDFVAQDLRDAVRWYLGGDGPLSRPDRPQRPDPEATRS